MMLPGVGNAGFLVKRVPGLEDYDPRGSSKNLEPGLLVELPSLARDHKRISARHARVIITRADLGNTQEVGMHRASPGIDVVGLHPP